MRAHEYGFPGILFIGNLVNWGSLPLEDMYARSLFCEDSHESHNIFPCLRLTVVFANQQQRRAFVLVGRG
jgi:hypothetical protein